MANNIEDDYRRTIAILEQLVKLRRGLHTAFDQEPNASPSVENRRERLSAGLRVIAIFIEKLVGTKYADPFDEVASICADLNAGAWPELAVGAELRDEAARSLANMARQGKRNPGHRSVHRFWAAAIRCT